VKFLVDAQLPLRLVAFLTERGHDAIHTSTMPDGNRSKDRAIAELADAEVRVVVSKDSDFRDGHLLRSSPKRLLVIATGNITNSALLALVEENLDAIVAAYVSADFVELGADSLSVHPRPAGP
jgi:predicted nuclease of predicted toxin-antitoxin system